MISLAEKEQRINIKELAFRDPQPPKRLKPEVDFSSNISWANTAMENVTFLPKRLKTSINELDLRLLLFESDNRIPILKERGTWQHLIEGNFDDQVAGLKLLLITNAESARANNRDINKTEAEGIRYNILSMIDEIGWEGISEHLQLVANYPEVLVWVAEVLTFQESTLTIPDYSQADEIIATKPEMPVRRRF
jgi:hypothetical protein